MLTTDVDEIFRRDPRVVPEALQEYGLLPRLADEEFRPAEILTSDIEADVVARLDPQRPHTESATMYASFPSGLHPAFNPPELLIWGTGHNLAYLILYFSGLPVARHLAAVDLQVWINATVRITATNSAGLTVSSGATSTRVVFQIPFTPNADGKAVVSLMPNTTSHGFSWFGTEVLRLISVKIRSALLPALPRCACSADRDPSGPGCHRRQLACRRSAPPYAWPAARRSRVGSSPAMKQLAPVIPARMPQFDGQVSVDCADQRHRPAICGGDFAADPRNVSR
jgi:hypothetical protein